MIVNYVDGDVLKTELNHIVFGTNVEGINDLGFAGTIAKKYCKGLANTGGNKLGDVITFRGGGKCFHAIVCHSLSEDPGWIRAPKIIEKAIDRLAVANDEVIAAVLIGAGIIGQITGADPEANRLAMERTKRRIRLYVQ